MSEEATSAKEHALRLRTKTHRTHHRSELNCCADSDRYNSTINAHPKDKQTKTPLYIPFHFFLQPSPTVFRSIVSRTGCQRVAAIPEQKILSAQDVYDSFIDGLSVICYADVPHNPMHLDSRRLPRCLEYRYVYAGYSKCVVDVMQDPCLRRES
jgi:hypothetical protein